MSEHENLEPWKKINLLVEVKDLEALHEFIIELPPSEIGRSLARMDEDERTAFLKIIKSDVAADFLESIAESLAADIVEDLPAEKAAEIIDELHSDHQADILSEMAAHDVHAILEEMDDSDAEDIRKLLQYKEDTAGAIMNTEFIIFKQDLTVKDVLEDLRNNREEYAGFGVSYTYVESNSGTLIGVLPLRELILAPSSISINKVMVTSPVYVLDNAPLDEVAQIFDQYPFFVLPVCNEHGKLIGVIHRGDAEEAELDRHERAFLKFSGIMRGEELRSMPLQERTISRLTWLGLNLLLSIIAASVILGHQQTITQLFILVFFMPIICNLSGCSGNQAVAVSIRELTLGLIKPSDYFHVWLKEVFIGLINGIVLGTVLGLAAIILWQDTFVLGIIIGVAFMLNTVVAVSLGGLIPLLLRYFKFDPALGAPPILTTLTDMCGFLFVLSMARIALELGIL